MSRKRYPIDQIITKLREAEVRISRGETVDQPPVFVPRSVLVASAQ